MRRKTRRALIGAVIAVLIVVGVSLVASAAYSRAGDYFERAGYIANCLPSVKPPATSAECAQMSKASDHLDEVPLTDESLTLSYASSIHTTGTAVLTIGGIALSLVVGMTGWAVAAARED